MQLGVSALGGGCCTAEFDFLGWDSAESRHQPRQGRRKVILPNQVRELNCTRKCSWGAHIQGIRGMQAEPLPVLTTLFSSGIHVLCDVYDMTRHGPSRSKEGLN